MQSIQPKNLSNTELIRIAADELDMYGTLPDTWQKELLRRFTALAPANEFPPIDEKQLSLFY
jgi:hypothetical protein